MEQLAMESTAPPIPNYAYVLISLKMSYKIYGIVRGTLLCHYWDINDVVLVGDLVQPGETIMACAIIHRRHLVNFRIAQNDGLYQVKVLDGFMDRDPA